MKAAVVGAGSWGTALATVLTQNGHETTLWTRRSEVATEISTYHTNTRYLPDVSLPDALVATEHLGEALAGAELVIFAVPSTAMAGVVDLARPAIPPDAWLSHAVKGFDMPSKRRMSEVLEQALPHAAARLSVISGPSHAEEVVRSLPTTLVVAAARRETAEVMQDALMNPHLRVYTNPDVVGAELGGSLKNIIALGVGIADGLGYGDNAKAALMTRGLAEIARLGMKMGASVLTFAGLSGVGDLIVTCTSRHSRNFRTGRLLGQGYSLQDALTQVGMAVEGIPTTRAAIALAADHAVEMPIAQALYDVLFSDKRPAEAVGDLMGRARSHEIEEVARTDIAPKWSL